jgi:cytochrome P450
MQISEICNYKTKIAMKSIPQVPVENFFTRNMLAFGRAPIPFFEKNRVLFGDVYESNLSPFMKMYVFCKPEYIKHFLIDNAKNYTKSFAYGFLRRALGNGLVTSEGDFWLRQRRIAQPAFHRERLVSLTQTMAQSIEEMLVKLDSYKANNQVFDIAHEMVQLTSEIAAKSLFSSDISLFKDKVIDCINNLNLSISNMIKSPLGRLTYWLPTRNNRFFEKNQKEFNQIIYSIIESRRKTNTTYHDLLQMLLEAKDEETGESMTNEQLRDEVITLFSAGSETSSNALAWTIYLLCTNPEKKEKLKQEINKIAGNRTIQFADIPLLTYTNQIIQETLRLYPPAWLIGREAKENDEVDGYFIPKKTQIIMPTSVIHRHPDLWENPHTFEPERFENEQVKLRHKFAHFPFGGGPRFCIGSNFAMMEMTLALNMIFQQFDFELLENQNIKAEALVTLKPKNEISVRIKK